MIAHGLSSGSVSFSVLGKRSQVNWVFGGDLLMNLTLFFFILYEIYMREESKLKFCHVLLFFLFYCFF